MRGAVGVPLELSGGRIIVNSRSLVVREDRGNVLGLVSTSDGGRAQFRIRFNHQDGGAGADAMPDPSQDMLSDSLHVSVNNILNSFQTGLPLADGPNGACRGTVTGYPVPAYTAAIVCEGRVFEDLAQAGPTALNPTPSYLQSTRVIEAFYRVSDFEGETPAEDAVGMAGGNVEMQLFQGANGQKKVSMTTFQGTGPARFRGRGDIAVTDMADNAALVDGSDANVSLLMLPDRSLTAILASGVARGAEDANGDFYKLTWDQAGTTSAGASKLKAGVYVYWQTDQKLHYYDKNYENYMLDIKANPTDPGTVVGALPQGISFVQGGTEGPDGVTSSKHRFVITKDIEVETSANKKITDLTIMPRAGAREDLDVGSGAAVNQSLADALGITPEMSQAQLVDSLATTTISLDPNQQGGSINQVMAQLADSGSMSFGADTRAGVYGPYQTQSLSTAWGMGGNYQSWGGSEGWTPPVDWGPPSTAGTVTWSGDSSISSTLTTPQILSALMSGKVATFENVQNPNPSILKALGNNRYRLRDDAIHRLVFGTTGGDLAEVDLTGLSGGAIPAGSETLGPRDFEVTLAPETEAGVRVTAPGDVRIAADVKGSGASISAKGDIRLVGVGFDLDAGSGEEGTDVSLYSMKDIVISTLRKEGDDYQFSGLDLRGVLYAWGNIELDMSHPDEVDGSERQKVHIQGTMVAYGGEPGKDRPGSYGGDVLMRADEIELVFDPGYLLGVSGAHGYKVTLAPLSQSYRQ